MQNHHSLNSKSIVDLPRVAYVHIIINEMKIPLQIIRQTNDTYLLAFRPTVAGDYSIFLKDFHEQSIPGNTTNQYKQCSSFAPS